jgi:hypothetical protein
MAELQPTRFFVVHLQKTAGTSLRDRFRATFENDAIYPNKTDGPVGHAVISLSHLLERWQARRHELRLIAGHFPLSTVELLDAQFVTLSVLRPVVDRTLSYLRHQQTLHADDRARSLEEIYDDPFRFRGLIRNHMTRMFSISAEEMTPGDGVLTDVSDSRGRLERAKEGVASLDAFGLQPHFEEFWNGLAGRFDLVKGTPVRSNVTTPDAAVPARLVERILEDNALDVELYEFAERLYEERTSR